MIKQAYEEGVQEALEDIEEVKHKPLAQKALKPATLAALGGLAGLTLKKPMKARGAGIGALAGGALGTMIEARSPDKPIEDLRPVETAKDVRGQALGLRYLASKVI